MTSILTIISRSNINAAIMHTGNSCLRTIVLSIGELLDNEMLCIQIACGVMLISLDGWIPLFNLLSLFSCYRRRLSMLSMSGLPCIYCFGFHCGIFICSCLVTVI